VAEAPCCLYIVHMHNTRIRRRTQARQGFRWLLVLALLGIGGPGQAYAQASVRQPVVHAVLFFSPTCPHCEIVIAEHLVPLQERYGDRLVILALDASLEYGGALFQSAMDRYLIPRRDWGVPFMIVGDQLMGGSLEIPARLPGLIEEGLAGGGIDLPEFPALISFLDAQGALGTIGPGPRYVYRNPSQGPPEAEVGPVPSETAETPPSDTAVVAAGVAAVPAATPDSAVEAVLPAAGTDSRAPATGDASPTPDLPGSEPPAGVRSDLEAGDRGPGDLEGTPSGIAGAPPIPESGEPAPPPAAAPATVPLSLEAARDAPQLSPWDRFARDRVGNSLALLVLLGMVAAILRSGDPRRSGGREWPEWATPALVSVGMLVALYLSYVEVTGNPATCGPVGDCNTVQQSDYARLFGFVPIGVLGVVGYVGVLTLWVLRQRAPARFARPAALVLWAFCLLGTGFSAYLTFLEPFVIGATCMWCLTSAVVMTMLLMASQSPAARVLAESGA